MATISELFIRIGVDVGGFQQNMALASQGVEGLVKSADATQQGLRTMGLAATAAGVAIVAALGFAIKVAQEAERVQRRLEQALISSGEGGKKEAEDLAELAKQLQSTSRFSDEEIKSNAALLLSMGAAKEEVAGLLPGIADLSVAMGIDLESATRAVGKALNGNVAILQRYGVQVGENIPASERFAALQRALGARAGAAAADVQTLGGALARLKNRIHDLQEVMGGPFLAPLTRLANAMSAGAEVVTKFLETNKTAAKVLGVVAAAMAVLLLGGGGVLIFLGTLSKMVALINGLAAALGTAAGATLTLRGALLLLGKATLITAVLSIAIVVIGKLIDRLGGLQVAMQTVGEFFSVFFKEIGEGFRLFAEGVKTFNVDKVLRGIEQMREAAGKASTSAKTLNAELRATEGAGGAAAKGLKKTGLGMDEINEKADMARKSIEIMVAELDAAAAQSARLTLQAPGLSEEQVRATEEKLTEIRLENAEDAAQRILQVEEEKLADILSSNEKNAKAIKDQEAAVAKARQNLENARLATVQRTAARIAEIEKALADERLDVERTLMDSRAEVERKTIQAGASLVKIRLEAERDAAGRVLDLVKREENARLAALQRVANLELDLQQRILTARQSLIDAGLRLEEAALRRRTAARTQMVKEGLLTEFEAEQQASADRLAFAQKRAQAELAQEQARLRMIQEQANIATGIAAADFLAKQRILVAENTARKAQLQAEFALKKADLVASEALLRAETQAKIAQLKLQFEARLVELEAEQAARKAAGQITPEEEAAFKQRIAFLRTQFAGQAQDLNDIVAQSQTEANAAFQQAQQAHDRAILDMDAATKQQLEAGELDFDATKKRTEAQRIQDSAAVVNRLTDIQVKLSEVLDDTRQALKEQGFLPSEIDAMLRPSNALLSKITNFTENLTRETKGQLDTLEGFYNDMLARLRPKLQEAVDLVAKLSNPQTLAAALGAFPAAFVPPVQQAATAQAGGTIIQLNGGQTITLTADEAAMIRRVLEKLAGPEGERIISDILDSQPGGPRR